MSRLRLLTGLGLALALAQTAQAPAAVAPGKGGGKAKRLPREKRVHGPDTVPRADTYTAKRKAERAKRKGNKKGFRK